MLAVVNAPGIAEKISRIVLHVDGMRVSLRGYLFLSTRIPLVNGETKIAFIRVAKDFTEVAARVPA